MLSKTWFKTLFPPFWVSWGRLTIVKKTKRDDRKVASVLSNNDWSSTKYRGKWRSGCQCLKYSLQRMSYCRIADGN